MIDAYLMFAPMLCILVPMWFFVFFFWLILQIKGHDIDIHHED